MLSLRSCRGLFCDGLESSVKSTSGYRTSSAGCDEDDVAVDEVSDEADECDRSGIVCAASGRSDVKSMVSEMYAGGGLHFSHCLSLEWRAVMILSCIDVRYFSPSSHFSTTTSMLCPQARY